MPEIVSLYLDAARSIAVERKDAGELPPDGIRLDAVLTGVSAGTERMWWEGTNPALVSGRRGYPYRPGYEFVGTVAEVGSSVDDVSPGQRVFAMKPHASGAVVTARDYWVPVARGVADEDALGIALTATCLHALHKGSPAAGDTVVVVGLGVVGFLCCQVLRASGAGDVIAVSRSMEKRTLALELGATAALAPDDPELEAQVRDRTDGRGADMAIECAGVSSAVETALRTVRNQGRVVVLGFHVDPIQVSGELFFSREVTLHSVRGSGSTEPTGEFNRWSRRENIGAAAELVAQGAVRTAPLVTHRVAPPNLEEAYEIISNPASGFIQVVLDWTARST